MGVTSGAARMVCALLLGLALLPHAAQGLKITVYPGGTECFTERITAEHLYTTAYGGPHVDGAFFVTSLSLHHLPSMSVKVYAPSGALLWTQSDVEIEAHFSVPAQGEGSYKACFQSHSSVNVNVDLIYFQMSHLKKSAQVNVPKGTHEARGKEMASKEHLDEVKRAVLVVGELVDILSGEQKYLQRKLDRHILTCHSNNRRALGYTSLEVVTLVGVGVFNVYIVSRMFKGRIGGRLAQHYRIVV